MPFVNGKFYANLLYGRALERARGPTKAAFGRGTARDGAVGSSFESDQIYCSPQADNQE